MKQSITMNFKNARFDLDDMKIIEETKDGIKVYDMIAEFSKFANVDGLSISIKRDADVTPESTEI